EPGEPGIVIVRGPNVFPGYKEAVHNQGVFLETGDGRGRWLNTGDMGYQDADGFFWLTGRKKELIIRGGHNIDPKQIEEPMYQHPAVALAAAVGRPDPRVGELPVVYVELKPDMTASEDELMAFAQTAIGERAAVPKQVRITEQLPLTAVGKVYKLPLIYEQVVDVFTAELRGIEGAATVDVRAEGHKQWGTLALVAVTAQPGVDKAHLEAAIRERLGSYPVRYELTVA
ncbi:MAG: AMP-binding protein, partial [Caldilinea sp.]|nr:AMP-binding protein [Caldilinea sp.]